MGRPLHRRFRRPSLLNRRRGDQGFVLLETLVSISLISIVMAGFTTFFINSVAFTSQQRATQVATQVANSAVEKVRGLPASDLTKGRDLTVVQAQFTAARLNSSIGSWLPTTAMGEAFDPAAAGTGNGAAAAVPTSPVTLPPINNVVYTVNEYLGACEVLALNASCLLHNPASTAAATQYLRLVVAVTWSGSRCAQSLCTYLTSTLITAAADPLFNLSTSPPDVPVMTNPGPQISAVNDVVKLRPIFTAFPRYRFSVAAPLPLGLALNTSTGLISGTVLPEALTGSPYTVVLTLTDGFDRTPIVPISFTWTILPAVVGAVPAAQASLVGQAIPNLTMSASGGQTPYGWAADPANPLPPGLVVSPLGVITGTPTSVGTLPRTYPVVLIVKDSVNRSATVPISWTVSYPPFAAANPGPQKSTVGQALVTLTLSTTGGSGAFTWTGGGTLPAGLTLTPAGVIAGTPTAVGTTSVTLTATDNNLLVSTPPDVFASQTFTFVWTVVDRPTVNGLANYDLTVGMVATLQLTSTCPNTPCTYKMNNGPATVAISSTGLLSGTITSAPQFFGAVTLTVTDANGAVGTSTSFWLRVNAAPVLTSPGTQTTVFGQTAALAAQRTGGSPNFTYSTVGLPTWLTLDTSTGMITGTAPSAAATTTGISLTVTDAYGFVAKTPDFSWNVGAGPSAPLSVAAANGDGTVTASWSTPATNNGAVVLDYTGRLGGVGGPTCIVTGLSCVFTGLTNGVHYPVTVTARNSYGSGSAGVTPAALPGIPYPKGVMSSANGMTLWLDGADPAVLQTTCAGPVTIAAIGCWKDKSGKVEDFAQGTGVNQPTVGTWNGLSAANFADQTDVLQSINGSDTYQTVFVAANVTNTPAMGEGLTYLFGRANADASNVRIGSNARITPDGNDWSHDTGTPPLNWTNGAQAVSASQPRAVITSDQALNPQTMTASVSTTFSNNGNPRGVTGQVGEVITFNKNLSTASRRSIEEYLANKWGLVLAPSAAPQAVVVVNGDTAVTASWTAPVSNTGGPVNGYTATASPGGASCTTTGALSCVIPGLINGGVYSITVTANNTSGPGPATAGVRVIPYPAVMSQANGMTLWLDGADPAVLLGNSDCTGLPTTTAVGCWKDKSGTVEDFVQVTPGKQPAVSTWNGLTAVNFAGNTRILNSVNGTGRYQTVIIAANVTNAGGSNVIIDLFGQAGQDFNVRVGTGANRTGPNGNDWSYGTGSPTLDWANGVQAANVTQPKAVITTDKSFTVQTFSASVSNSFAPGGVPRGLIGQIGDVVTFSRQLTVPEQRSIEAYLSKKWGVTVV